MDEKAKKALIKKELEKMEKIKTSPYGNGKSKPVNHKKGYNTYYYGEKWGYHRNLYDALEFQGRCVRGSVHIYEIETGDIF